MYSMLLPAHFNAFVRNLGEQLTKHFESGDWIWYCEPEQTLMRTDPNTPPRE